MPGWALKAYVAAFPELYAEQQLSGIRAADAPHLTKSARADLFRELQRQLPAAPAERATEQQLAAAGITVEYVPREEGSEVIT